MSRWAPLPPRQPGEALASIHFTSDKVGESMRYIANFRHRDNRIWQAIIRELDTSFDENVYHYVIEMSTGGCRSWRFLAKTFEQAKRLVDRFSNMEISRYNRLTVDAQGTNEFPVPGQIGVFRMRLCEQRRTTGNRSETIYTDISGIARYDGTQIVVYPRTQELTDIISDVCGRGTVAMIPQQINEIQDPSQENRILLAAGPVTRGVVIPEVAEDDIATALNRLRNDTTESVLAGVQSGAYRVSRGREERAFELGDDEEEETT